jgi:hypothetical protein
MKNILLIPIVLVLLISLVAAADMNILNAQYAPGETVQLNITNTSISTSQISLLDNTETLIPISPLKVEYKDNYNMVYFNLPTDLTAGTYTVLAASLQDTFTLVPSDIATQFKPGIIVLDESQTNFKIELTNVFDSNTLTFTSSNPTIASRKSVLSFEEGETKNLFVDYTYNLIEKNEALTINYASQSFTIPIIYPEGPIIEETINITNETITPSNITNLTIETTNLTENITIENITIIEITDGLSFLVKFEETTTELALGESQSGPLKIQNNLDISLLDITFSITGSLADIIELEEMAIDELKAGEIYEQFVWVNKEEKTRVFTYEGDIIATSGNELASTHMTVKLIETSEEEPVETNQEDFIFIEPDFQEEGEGSNATVIIGIILIILLLAIFFVIYLKLRQSNEKQFNNYIEETRRR